MIKLYYPVWCLLIIITQTHTHITTTARMTSSPNNDVEKMMLLFLSFYISIRNIEEKKLLEVIIVSIESS